MLLEGSAISNGHTRKQANCHYNDLFMFLYQSVYKNKNALFAFDQGIC